MEGISHSEFLIKKTVYNVIKHALNDEMPISLEERTRQKVLEASKQKPQLKIIEGAKSYLKQNIL